MPDDPSTEHSAPLMTETPSSAGTTPSGGTGVVLPADSAVAVCQWTGCGEGFTDLVQLVRHLNSVHIGRKQGTYACQWEGCGRYGIPQSSRFSIISHLRGHTGEKPFDCPVAECDRSFSRSDALAKHFKVHDLPDWVLQESLSNEVRRRKRPFSSSTMAMGGGADPQGAGGSSYAGHRMTRRSGEGDGEGGGGGDGGDGGGGRGGDSDSSLSSAFSLNTDSEDEVVDPEETEEEGDGKDGEPLSLREQYLIQVALYDQAVREYEGRRREEAVARKKLRRLRTQTDRLWKEVFSRARRTNFP
ncbi:MAG: hypothetical protein DHS80DRAFT_30034 [Piptocephalis tieghemiana]|nr:MAG: hypothetical protein DHS80DRAFT_30034 [Piptocephalis tieghemiana]